MTFHFTPKINSSYAGYVTLALYDIASNVKMGYQLFIDHDHFAKRCSLFLFRAGNKQRLILCNKTTSINWVLYFILHLAKYTFSGERLALTL